MASAAPPIVKQAETLLVEIERAVHRFSRSHKYPYGMELRALAMKVAKLAHRAWRDRAQLQEWLERIRSFLRETLQLELKDDIRLRPLSAGIDFMGYVIFPTHRRVRARVVRHAESALRQWERMHVRGDHARGKPADFRHVRSVWASYSGHLDRANAWRLRQRFHLRFPWLQQVCVPSHFNYRLEGRTINVEIYS